MTRATFLVLASGVTMAGILVAIAGALPVVRHARGRTLALGAVAVYVASLTWQPPVGLATNLLTIAGGIGGAALIGRGLGDPRSVVVFLAVAAAVDLLSFADGLTHAIIEGYRTGENQLLLHLTLTAPVAGQWTPIVGVGDLVIGGAAGSALVRLGRPFPHVIGVLWAALLVALVVGLWRGGVAAVPFMAAAVALYAWPRR